MSDEAVGGDALLAATAEAAAPRANVLEVTPLELGGGERIADELQHWRLRRDADGVYWALLDQTGTAANTLNEPVLEELERIVERVRSDRPPGLVLRSAKPAGFAAGADIGMFRGLTDPVRVRELVERGHRVVNALADLDLPTVALIHGHCLGGGLELALACRYRFARRDASLGFPEVQLGLHPGLGGTARLPALVRPDEALKLMLTGRSISAERARSLGLIDAVAEERHFARAVQLAVAGQVERRGGGAAVRGMTLGPARMLVARQARSETAKRAREEHYPAPYRLLDLWERHGGSVDDMLRHEPASFAELLTGETAQNLVRVYFLREALRGRGKGRPSAIHRVHVIGAGTMGGDIAAWCAHRGLVTTLEDREARLIAPAIARATELFERRYDDRRARQAAHDRLVPDPSGAGRRKADLVIEAVPEDLELKRRIFGELEGQVKDGALLASNTSGLLLQDIGQGLRRPERLIGLHFFNPVARMQLVEVVRHPALDPALLARALAFVLELDRLPVPVQSAPGFLVNRILSPYLLEAVLLLDEGVAAERVDAAAEAFGMPMGPAALADQVGLDIALEVGEGLRATVEPTLPEVPEWVRRKVADGHLGVKSGRGIYEYEGGTRKKRKAPESADPAHIDRLMLPMVNTAVTCLGEGIVDDADALDAAMVFGTGFAPFRGGPLHYARERGPEALRRRLEELAEQHGPRFRPSPYWSRVFAAAAGEPPAAPDAPPAAPPQP
ncbi:MAG TPA: 3-hydroxyacyl-CoA dehydrogenase NAD-binding domain-containing protein [Pseudomonadales bacterium]